jgi:transglutaminase-like putative cysteine protease
MKQDSKNIEDYLKHDSIIDWRNPIIKRKAAKIVDGIVNEIDKARYIYEWVRDKIPHSNDINAQVLSCSATEVLNNETGMCFSKSHLLAALLRSVNIPTGFCYQVLMYDPPVDNTLVLHGLNGIYLSVVQKWVVVDARGNTRNLNAQFSIDIPKLAFSMDYSKGEYLYETIFVSPFEHVVERLKKYKNRMDFSEDIPKPIE